METKNVTIEDRLNEVEKMRNRYAKNAEDKLEEYLAKAKQDYCNFFHWNADDAYIAQKVYDYFSHMAPITVFDDPEALKANLGKRIKRIEHNLIHTSAFGSCTNEIVNLEHRLKLAGERNIREKLLEMIWMLEYEK